MKKIFLATLFILAIPLGWSMAASKEAVLVTVPKSERDPITGWYCGPCESLKQQLANDPELKAALRAQGKSESDYITIVKNYPGVDNIPAFVCSGKPPVTGVPACFREVKQYILDAIKKEQRPPQKPETPKPTEEYPIVTKETIPDTEVKSGSAIQCTWGINAKGQKYYRCIYFDPKDGYKEKQIVSKTGRPIIIRQDSPLFKDINLMGKLGMVAAIDTENKVIVPADPEDKIIFSATQRIEELKTKGRLTNAERKELADLQKTLARIIALREQRKKEEMTET